MRNFIYRHWDAIGGILLAVALLLGLLFIVPGCGALKRSGLIGGGAGAGAAVGTALAGPAGGVGGAVVGGAVTSAVVEADASEDRADAANDRAARAGTGQAPPAPWWDLGLPWWSWLLALWVWLRRAHLADAITGKEPRLDAILRALGLRTHKTPSTAAIARRRAGA